jgi:hypothetical protein
MRRVAQVDLMRGQNRYLAAIAQARRIVAAALADGAASAKP